MSMLEAGGMALAGWVALFFAISLVGTWLARGYALRNHLLDHPGERRSHDVATPRGGGIAIVAALLVAIGCLILRDPGHAPLLSAIGLGLATVAGIGWADDHQPLSSWLRLAVQGVAAMLLACGILHEGGSAWAVVSAFVAAMVLVNVWNFMDGIDALAASQALVVALGYGVLAGQGALALLAFALAAACLGFLPHNVPKARIFLGDVGSGALGYALAALGGWLALRDWARAPLLLLPLSAFLIDASLTLLARMVQRQHWWLPHTQHAYQCWARRIQRHGMVTLAYAGWTVAATIFMLATSSASPAFIMSALLATSLGGWLAWAWLRRDSRRIRQGDRE